MTAWQTLVLCAAGLWLGACAVPRAVAPAAAPAPAPDPSEDWRVLERAPFGTPLRAAPFRMHEVLLFHDAERDATEARDCYAIDGEAPRLLGFPVDLYVVCFERDRLTRVEAAVMLPPDDAPAIFARACARWLSQASPSVVPAAADRCVASDRGVTFSARLAGGADEPAGRVSVTLHAVRDP